MAARELEGEDTPGQLGSAGGDSRRSTRIATLALLVVTVIWGWTFVWMKQGLNAANAVLGPGHTTLSIGVFVSLRFGLAALIMAAVRPRLLLGATRQVWTGGAVLGALLWGGFFFQMAGLEGVSPPVSAFLTSLYVVFTALMQVFTHKHAAGRWLWAGVVLATVGAGFISGPPQLSFDLPEWLTVGCAFVFALHILATDVVTKRVSPLPVTLTSFVWTAAGGAALVLVASRDAGSPGTDQLRELVTSPDFAKPLLLSCVLATVLAISLMNTFQRVISPTRAAILYAIEPIWASVAALSMGMQQASGWLLFGGIALVSGNLIAECGPLVRAKRGARR